METIEYDYSIHTTPNAGDDTLLVKFEIKPVLNKVKTLKEGREIWEDVEHIDIRVPGSRDNVCRPVRDSDKDRFPRHYAMFKNRTGNEEKMVGTPLTEWHMPELSKGRVEELRFLNIRTVEQLAGANDNVASKIMGFNHIKTAAKTWLEATKSAAPVLELTSKLQASNARINKLEAQIAMMLEGQEAKASKRKSA